MKKKLIIAFIVFSVIGGGIFYFLTTGNVGEKYNTVEVKQGQVEKYVEAVGRISSKNIRKYYGNGANRVEEMALVLGDHVEKGQLLVKYEDNLDLEIQKVEKQIEALEATYNEILSGRDMESVNNAKIEISRIKNNLELAILNKDRIEKLYNNQGVSKIELEQAVNNVQQLQSSLAIAQNTYSQLVKGVSANTKKKYEAEIEALLLTIETLEKNRENYRITADIDGIVTALETFKGDMPSPGTMILEIQDPSEKILLVDFMVEDAQNIKKDMQGAIEDKKLGINIDDLRVDKIHPKAFVTLSELGVEENRQTVEMSLPKTAEALPYGLEVDTKVMVEATRAALLIPIGAVYQQDSKKYVKVLEDKKPVEREIITGIEVNNTIEVKDGLTEGELIILNYEED